MDRRPRSHAENLVERRLVDFVADLPCVDKVSQRNRERLVTIGARVPAALAEAVAELADAGDRSLSREIRRAVQEHVQASQVPRESGPSGADPPAPRGDVA